MNVVMMAPAVVFHVRFEKKMLQLLIRAGKLHYSRECKAAATRINQDLTSGFLHDALDEVNTDGVARLTWRQLDVIAKICELADLPFGLDEEFVIMLSTLQIALRCVFAQAQAALLEWHKEIDI